MAGNLLFNKQREGTGTDVAFIVEGLTIPAHKLVLTARSGPLVDMLEKDGNVIHIEDVSARVFQSIIQYLYTGEYTVSPSNAFEIQHAAKKFGIKELEDQCVTIIATKLNKDNFLAYSQEAIDFDSKEFLSSCKEYAKQNAKAIVKQPSFKNISIEVLELICSLEGTNSELAIFAACVGWAEEECKRQKLEESPETMLAVLGNVLDKIKFEDMALDDFIKYVVPEGILTNEKIGQLISGWQKDKKEKDWKEALLMDKQKEDEGDTLLNEASNKTTTVSIWDPSLRHWTHADLPLHTRIRDIKEMKIFNYGELQGPGDQFTLEYVNANRSWEPVPDSTTLTSIKKEGEDCIQLRVTEMTCRVKDSKDRWEIPVTFTWFDLCYNRTDEVIRGRMRGHCETRDYDIGSAKIETPSSIIPGSTFIVTAEPRHR